MKKIFLTVALVAISVKSFSQNSELLLTSSSPSIVFTQNHTNGIKGYLTQYSITDSTLTSTMIDPKGVKTYKELGIPLNMVFKIKFIKTQILDGRAYHLYDSSFTDPWGYEVKGKITIIDMEGEYSMIMESFDTFNNTSRGRVITSME
jgi:hypothetical protein